MYKQIINDSFNKVFEKKSAIFKALLLPFLILSFMQYLSIQNQGNLPISVLVSMVSFLVSVNIAISVHRILLKENSVPTWGFYSIGKREAKFFLTSFLIMLFIIFPTFILAMIPNAFILAIPLAIFIFSRFALALPSIAIDDEISLKDSWELTSNHKLLVVVTTVIVPIFIALVIGFVYTLVISYLIETISQKLAFLYSILNIIITVFMISCLSSTYRYIRGVDYEIHEDIQNKDISINEEYLNEDTFKLSFSNNIDEDFEYIKHYLYAQYEELGFTEIAIDKNDKFMLKNVDSSNSYVLLSENEDVFSIEVYNTAKPYLDFLDKY